MLAQWFVSRATYDRLMAQLEQARAYNTTLFGLYNDERGRNDGLVQQIIDLKREGFHPGTPAEALVAAERKPMPEGWVLVEDAIADRSGGIRALERQLRGDAHTMREAGLEPDAIAKRIYRGRGSE